MDRRTALGGVPTIRPGVSLEDMADGNVRVTMTIKRGTGFFERMRPPETKRSYDLDEFGTFAIRLVNGNRTVLDVVNEFEKRFKLSRREVELSVVAFFKLLMQRNVLAVVVPDAEGRMVKNAAAAGIVLGLSLLVPQQDAIASGAASMERSDSSLTNSAAGPDEASATMAELKSISEDLGTLLPGSIGNLKLQDMVAQRFKDSGFETGAMEFEAPLLEPGSLEITCGIMKKFQLDAMHPSLMRPGNFSTNEFRTRLVYMGKGELTSLERVKGVNLKNAIAVMDYDSDDKWMDLLRFGFEGFIFAGSGDYPHKQSLDKVYNSEVSVPRFFIDGDAGRKLAEMVKDKLEVEADAKAVPTRWRPGKLRNLWVLIPGSDTALAEKTVVFTAPMDANSIVPARAYGAQRAINLHVLLKLLEDFRKSRPAHSVLLVAVNGHTQYYAGERLLAWHLLAPEDKVEEIRDEIAAEMRLARLHSSEYGKLHLDRVADEDRKDLHVMMVILRQLEGMQSVEREQKNKAAIKEREKALELAAQRHETARALEELPVPEPDDVLDLSRISESKLKDAIAKAGKEMLEAYDGFFANRGRDAAEVEIEKQENKTLLETIENLPFEEFMVRAKRLKSVFDDEKLFEKWRGDIDASTGRRIYVKTRLQDEFKSLVNSTMQDILVVSSTNMTKLAEEERKSRITELNEQRDNLRRVLVLFNKMDLGVGRSRTYYHQIALNDVQRAMLRSAVDKYVEQYGKWGKIHEDMLKMDTAAGDVRAAVGRRKVLTVLELGVDGHAEQVGFTYESLRIQPGWFNGFASVCTNAAAAAEKTPAGRPHYVDALSGDTDKKPRHYFTNPESSIYYFQSAQNTPAFALKSAYSDEGSVFGPSDTIDKLNPRTVNELQGWMRKFLTGLVDRQDLSARSSLKPPRPSGNIWSVLMRTYNLEQFSGKPIPTRPVPGCLVAMYEKASNLKNKSTIIDGSVVNCYMGMTDETAMMLHYGLAELRQMCPTAYLMDHDFNEVLFAVDKGRVQSSKQINSNISRSTRATVPMFECREFVIKDRRDPAGLSSSPITIRNIWPKKAKGQSDPEKYGVHGAACLSPAQTHDASGPIGIYLYRRRAEMEQDSLMVITDRKRCALNSTIENPQGIGFRNQDEFGDDLLMHAAADMALLNKSRSTEMKGVVNQLLDEFLEKGDRLYAEAMEKRAANDHIGYLSRLYEAFGNQVKAYREIAKMNEDMLKAVIAYMALMLPFCFFLQKLLFNFKKLEHELAGFSALFVGMFVLFRFIHPAFRIAMCPEAIFIAFVLGAIGAFTTGVLHSRFNEEMTILFRGVGGIGEEVGYGTVGTTAMLIGVQNMRRRRVRTGLTTATIVLVVFTMLAFSSVSRKAKPTLVPKADSAPYTGLFYHWPGGLPIEDNTVKTLSELFGDRAEVNIRRILKRDEKWRIELASDPSKYITVEAVSGLSTNDAVLSESMALIEGGQFSSASAGEIYLPVTAADALGLSSADVGKAKVSLLGREWVLKALIDDQRYKLARDLNPSLSLVPFKTIEKKDNGDDTLDIEAAGITEKLIETESLAIIPEGIAAELGAAPRSVSIVFRGDMGAGTLGRELQRILDVTDAKFYLGSREPFKIDENTATPVKPGVYYVGSSYRTAIGGLAKLLIPLLIAGSIILNTMLGTVYERKSEIAVFNAIGLNPTHIFMFFLAEAIVYSFIGAVGGYLIGQLLTISLKAAGLIREVNINFSSLMVVYAVLFTMALVILSTLYPGYVATRTAVPSGKRKWTMPSHDGQHMSIIFPFIYRSELTYGVMYYLEQFFEPLSDQSLGDIISRLEEIKTEKDPQGRPILSLRYNIALAPYDLGVTQNVTFITRYDEVVRSFRLHMDVDRISGRDTNWITTNKPFLERMRKFLIRWRNIDPTRQKWFVKNARQMFEDGVPPRAVPEDEAVSSKD